MLESPFRYQVWFKPAEYQKVGELAMQWSSIEHVIGNCLKALLKLTDDEALILIFPLPVERLLNHLKELCAIRPIKDEARIALDELIDVMRGIQYVRNTVVHGIAVGLPPGEYAFRLHSKQREIAKDHIFATEELTAYAAHAALALRFALGFQENPDARHTLPGRPEIPEFLRELIPTRKKEDRQP